jgi:hypothetical protein
MARRVRRDSINTVRSEAYSLVPFGCARHDGDTGAANGSPEVSQGSGTTRRAARIVARRTAHRAPRSRNEGEMISALKNLEFLLHAPKLLSSASGPADSYEYMGDDVVGGENGRFADSTKPLWLNLGYWRTARTYVDAARAMAELVADAAELGPDDDLLDVGFGFAEQDLFWVDRYRVKHIVGLNSTPMHV